MPIVCDFAPIGKPETFGGKASSHAPERRWTGCGASGQPAGRTRQNAAPRATLHRITKRTFIARGDCWRMTGRASASRAALRI